jgi:ubiquinone/menaquinone biosynthesis C-methylase UbiE
MSSWVSHLPDSWSGEVVGHGLNAEELAANDRLDEWVLQNLNEEQTLPFPDAGFDAVLCAVSVQYLQYPGTVFTEIARVLAPGGVCVVSFSNRMFVQKAVRAWRNRDMDGRAALVARYVESTGEFTRPDVVKEQPADDPFYAVVARRR